MPYISQDRRADLTPIAKKYADNSGDLNYQITYLLLEYMKGNGKSYKTINDVVGALACASAEFYRRIAVDYEKQKINDNGDVY
jgi:hypothetical protein